MGSGVTPTDVLAQVRELDLPAYGDDEVLFMAKTMRDLRPGVVFEWGTNVGASARIFREAASVLGFSCEVHTFELPAELAALDRDHPGERLGLHSGGVPGIWHHFGDGLYSALLLHARIRPSRALFYLDGCHKAGVVLHELESIASAAPEAVILVHDTVELTGMAITLFRARSETIYTCETLESQAGMARLWPASD
jgi:hypothetical protein